MKDEVLKLVLEGAANYIDALGGDSRKYRQALAAFVQKGAIGAKYQKSPWDEKGISMPPPAAPVQDSTCNNSLREQGKAYPRTCRKCGKGPCIALVNAALDRKAENARELGLDYEPDLQAELDATNRQVEILSDALAESRRGVDALVALARADEREKAKHNEEVLMNALWKACGDDGQMVVETIESQGELK